MPVCIGPHGRREGRSALASASECLCPLRIVQAHTARLGDGLGLLGASGDRLSLLLRHGTSIARSRSSKFVLPC
jgi:hypothetical protein